MNNHSKTAASPRAVWWLIAVLILLAIAGISGRLLILGKEPLAGGDRLWRLSVNVSTFATPNKTAIKIYPPVDTNHIHTIERNLSFPGFTLQKSVYKQKYRRSISILANENGRQYISAEYLLHLSQTPLSTTKKKVPALTTSQRENTLLDNSQLQIKSYIVKETLNKLVKKQPFQEALVNEIYSFIKLFPFYSGNDAQNVPQILTRNKATLYDKSLLMVALCRAAGIPAQLVTGLILNGEFEPQPHYWVEVFENNQWSSYDIYYGYKKTVPANYLPLRRNAKDIVQITRGTDNKITYELEQEFSHPYLRQKQKDQFIAVFDLVRLPLYIRNELALLLLLPLGAMITALFRHLVGVRSYGVFTPTLLALAFIYANFITTLVIFMIVITLTLGGRSVFPSTLTRIPRLSIIFTLIAIFLTMSVSALNYFGIDQGGRIILLPTIILTSLVDRFYRTIEEKGLPVALKRMTWTVIIAFICLPVIQFEKLGHFILQYPETHFATLALFLLISLYKGKQLTSLPYIKRFAETGPIKKQVKDNPNNAP